MFKSKTTIVLTISIILNFIFMGIFIGYKIGKCNKFRGCRQDLTKIEQIDIPSEKKKLILDTMQSLKELRKSKYSKMKDNKSKLIEMLSAENFDKAAYKNQLDKIVTEKNNLSQTMSTKMFELVDKLDTKERQFLADVLSKQLKKYKKMSRSKFQ